VDFVICRLFTRLPPVLQVIGHGCVLMFEIWWIFLHYIFKNCLFVKKKCCEWKTLFVLFVTDTQRRLIAALVIDERQKGKNPPIEFPLYSVHRNHVE
jgi:hypothetical protein